MKQTVYIACPESQQIHVWRLNEQQETLSLIQEVDVAAQVQPLAISPDGRFLYAGVRPEFCVLTFRIDDDGRLQQAGSVPLIASPTYISLNGDGQFLFSGSYNGACVSVIKLEQGLAVATEQLIEQLDGCHSVNLAPDQRTLWVPALKQDRIYLFTQSDNGQLQPRQPTQLSVTAGAGPRHMVFHPDQPVAYCINELDACVDVWQYQQDQQIRCLQRLDMMHVDFNGTRWAADIHITPDGRFLYSCERSASIITVFAVSDNGCQLTVLAHQPTETQPRGFNLDKTGQFLIAVGQKSHHATLYRIDQQTGLLQEKARYATGRGPMWVVVHGC